MTGPSSNPRPRVDQLTDDTLDQLYAELDQARAEIERMKLLVAASSEDGQAIRMAAQYAERAIENGERADRAEQLAADLRTQAITEQKRAETAEADRDALIDERDKLDRKLTTMTDVARSNLKHVQAIVPELEQAEAAIARVRALADETDAYGYSSG